jgi:hypothetical protein
VKIESEKSSDEKLVTSTYVDCLQHPETAEFIGHIIPIKLVEIDCVGQCKNNST